MFAGLGKSACCTCKLHRLLLYSARQRFYVHSRSLHSRQTSVDSNDMKAFAKLLPDWTKEDGSFKALYAMNRLRVPLVVSTIGRKCKQDHNPLLGLRIADIGCGGGILTFPLARLGANVAAVDTSIDVIASIEETKNCFHRTNCGPGNATFKCSSVEDFAAKNVGIFDAVVASEIIEHVADVELFVESCIQLVRKNGALFFTTINKTVASRVMAIWMAEKVLGIVPSGIHNWSKFVKPKFLRLILEENGCSVRLLHGMTYNPLINHWSWSRNTSINYALVAIKN